MTIHTLYYRAATLKLAHELANARTAALDCITSRRTRLGANTLDWRQCGARAARITMDRGYDAVVARVEARDRMLVDQPWRVPLFVEGRRG